MKHIRIGIISDIHVGRAARSSDLCPHAESDAIEPRFRTRFVEFLKRERIVCDLLIISGDVTNIAAPAEFQLASTAIAEIAEALGVSNDRIVFAPGNHDVDWLPMRGDPADTTGVRREQRYAPLKSDRFMFNRIMNSAKRSLTDPPYFSYWIFDRILVVALNSSWHDNPDIAIHRGQVAPETIESLNDELTAIGDDLQLRILVVHHHPVPLSDPIPETPEFSEMTNSEALLRLLTRWQFDVLIHGHRHMPKFQTYSLNAGFPLVIISAGSFSVLLEPRWTGKVSNQFHLLTINGRDADTGTAFGEFVSWAYVLANGWMPSSDEHHGIAHRQRFGSYTNPNVLYGKVLPIASAELRAKGHIEWPKLAALIPDLQYLPGDRTEGIIGRLERELSVRAYRRGSGDNIVLLP